MSIAKCFSALGFLELPRTEQEVTDAYLARVEDSYYETQCYECPDITDQAQIQEILENTINTNWSWQTGSYTDFFEDEKNGRFELTFRFKDESLSSCYYRFIKGKTPDFMGEDYIEQGKEQSESNYNFYNF